MAEEASCEKLEQHSITSLKYEQDSSECYYFDSDFSFRHQLFEDDSELSDIQSSAILGSIYKKYHLFNTSKYSFETNSKPFQSLNSKCAAILLKVLTRNAYMMQSFPSFHLYLPLIFP